MTITKSKVAADGRTSVPMEVRKKLGIGAGSVIEWFEQGGQVVVRRASRYSSLDLHQALFATGRPKTKRPLDVKAGIRKYIRAR